MGTSMTRDSALIYIRSQQPVFLPKAKKRGFICPKCHNGSGKDGDGIVRNPKNGSYKCFKCDFSGDVFDLVGAEYGIDDFNGQFKKAAEFYGVSVEKYQRTSYTPQHVRQNTVNAIKDVTADISKPAQQEEDLTLYYQQCHDKISWTTYLTGRGITEEIINKFNIGYDPEFSNGGKLKHPIQAVILPTSKSTYEARSISAEENGKGFRYCKYGPAFLFNSKALSEETDHPVFVVEGIIDALSVMSAGGVATRLGSAVNYRLLLAELDKAVILAKPLILLFDNDEAGAENEAKLAAELNARKITYLRQPGGDNHILSGYHDPNDMLQRKILHTLNRQ